MWLSCVLVDDSNAMQSPINLPVELASGRCLSAIVHSSISGDRSPIYKYGVFKNLFLTPQNLRSIQLMQEPKSSLTSSIIRRTSLPNNGSLNMLSSLQSLV